ncbi:MAG: TonB-dependent receptor, partial [Proteobacteria bacterium]|nr:TonB-dependent receptor [Pseudomonadota bacterium]
TLTIRYDFDDVRLTAASAYYERHERVNGYNGTLYDLSYFQQLLDPSQPGGPVDPAGNPCPACRSDLFPLLRMDGLNLPGAPPFLVDATIFNAQFNYTQEVRLESSDADAPVNWLIGAFYAEQKEHSTDRSVDPDLVNISPFLFGESVTDIWGMGLLPGNVEYINDTVSHDRQLALFADATLNLTRRLKLDAGVRYAWTHFDFVNYADGPLNFGASGGSGSENERPLTPRLGLSFQADADNLFYASVARGYRPGGANAPFPESICQADLDAMQISSTPASYQSDTVTSYEAGARNRLLNRRVTAAFSVYHAVWDRIQQANYLASCGFQYTANLGAAVSDGFDLDADVTVTDSLKVTLSLGYTDARYSRTTRTGPAVAAPILSNEGDSLGAPRWTVALGAQYDFFLADEPAFVRLDYAYASTDPRTIPARDPSTTSYDPYLPRQPETHYLSVRAGADLGFCDINVFADNLLNAHPQLNLNHQDQFTELLEATTFRPRTIGLSLTRRY